MKEIERVFRAVANRRRLQILRLLGEKKELPVMDISRSIRLSFRTTSKHLGLLAGAGFLDREQRGGYGYYRIADDLSKLARSILPFLR